MFHASGLFYSVHLFIIEKGLNIASTNISGDPINSSIKYIENFLTHHK